MHATALSLLSIAGSLAAAAETGASGTIAGKDTGLSGTVSVANDRTLTISDFTLDAAVAPALFWRGSKTSDLSAGFRLSNERVTRPASHETVTIQLDASHTTADFDFVGLFDEELGSDFGSAQLKKNNAGNQPGKFNKRAGQKISDGLICNRNGDALSCVAENGSAAGSTIGGPEVSCAKLGNGLTCGDNGGRGNNGLVTTRDVSSGGQGGQGGRGGEPGQPGGNDGGNGGNGGRGGRGGQPGQPGQDGGNGGQGGQPGQPGQDGGNGGQGGDGNGGQGGDGGNDGQGGGGNSVSLGSPDDKDHDANNGSSPAQPSKAASATSGKGAAAAGTAAAKAIAASIAR